MRNIKPFVHTGHFVLRDAKMGGVTKTGVSNVTYKTIFKF